MRLEFRLTKTGISLMAPLHLTMEIHSLPAMLHMIS